MLRRLIALFTGLWLYGFSMAVMIRAAVGLGPWDVFHQGVTRHVPLGFGTVTALTGAVVLLAWIPLRQRPGVGTVSNVVMIGISVDMGLWLLPHWQSLPVRLGAMALAVVLNALASVLYIGAGLGPGPRDGLMTGLVHRTGWSIRLVRTAIEVSVLATGWLLGGGVGIGTVVYAVCIGPLIQMMIPLVAGRLPGFHPPHAEDPVPARTAGPLPSAPGCADDPPGSSTPAG
ncbi:membrane protein YczE [Nocardia sp. X0981]